MLETQTSDTTFVRSLISWSMFDEVEAALVGQAEPTQPRAGTVAEQLPRHDVGVVLHLA